MNIGFVRTLVPVLALVLVGATGFVAAGAFAPNANNSSYTATSPYVARDGLNPTPTPRPPTPTPVPAPVDLGPPRVLSLPSAYIPPVYIEQRHTVFQSGGEFFDVPSNPSWIAWYYRFSTLGRGGQNTIFSAHINHVSIGNGPFRYLTSAAVGDTLSISTDNGTVLRFSVQSVRVIHLSNLDMDAIVYPSLPQNRERVTLISCGGTFVPYPGGGGEYDSRVILVAERIIS